jgi:hypothetical protein
MNKKNRTKNKSEKKYFITISIVLSLLIFLISIFQVHALGIMPSKKIIDYDDVISEYPVTSRVINNEGRDVAVKITAGGELSKYITIAEPLIYISSEEPESEFTYTINLPPGLEPGTKTIDITISETSLGINDANSIGGLLTVTQQLQIIVPYNGKYVEGYISTYPTEEDNKISAIINIMNRGTENIESLRGTIKVIDTQNNVAYQKELSEYQNLGVKQAFKIEEPIIIDKPGSYKLIYDVTYDSKELTLNKDFSIGKYNLSVTGANVDNFKLGTIAKFNIGVASEWNSPIGEVYAEITISDSNGTIISRVKTDKTTINMNNNEISAYWDTANIKSGEYLLSIIIHAGDQIISKEYYTIVAENKITVGNEDNTEKSNNRYFKVAIVLMAMTIASIILLSILIPRRRKT